MGESEKERDGQREEGRERYMYFTDKVSKKPVKPDW